MGFFVCEILISWFSDFQGTHTLSPKNVFRRSTQEVDTMRDSNPVRVLCHFKKICIMITVTDIGILNIIKFNDFSCF